MASDCVGVYAPASQEIHESNLQGGVDWLTEFGIIDARARLFGKLDYDRSVSTDSRGAVGRNIVDLQDRDQEQPKSFKYLSADRMLSWKTEYAMSSMPMAGHWAPCPVKTNAKRGCDLILVALEIPFSVFCSAVGLSAMVKPRHA